MQQAITCVINGNAYKLSAGDVSAMSNMPEADREPLLLMVDAIKAQQLKTQAALQQALHKTTHSASAAAKPAEEKPERLGAGDIDALMAKLVLEEKQQKKPPLTQQKIIKIMLAVVAAIILITLIF